MNRLCTRSLIATLAVLSGTAIGHAQSLLYNHGEQTSASATLATGHFTTGGDLAPGGALWSELQSAGPSQANSIAGVRAYGPYRVAQQFTVPIGQAWRVEGVRVFAYQPDAGTSASPFSGMNLQIWNGSPASPSAKLIGGSASSNVYASSTFTSIYRTFATALEGPKVKPDRSRAIWQIDSKPLSIVLPAGTYWLDWQLSSDRTSRSAYVPTVTSPGALELNASGSMQLVPTDAAPMWTPITDRGISAIAKPIPQDLPFQLIGELLPTSLADIAGPDGTLGSDGRVDTDDLIAFELAYETADLHADFVGASGKGSAPDGQITTADLTAFLEAFARGYE